MFSPLLQDELATAAAAAESLQLAKVAVSSNPVVVTTALKWCSRSSVTLRSAGSFTREQDLSSPAAICALSPLC